MDPNYITIIITGIATLIAALGGPKILEYIKSRRESEDTKEEKYENLLQKNLQDLKNVIVDLKVELEKRDVLIEKMRKDYEGIIDQLRKDNTDMTIKLAKISDKLTTFYGKFGLGKSIGKDKHKPE